MVFRLPLRTHRHMEPPVLPLHFRLFSVTTEDEGCHSSVGSTRGLRKFTVIHDQWCCCSSGGYSEVQQSHCEYSLL